MATATDKADTDTTSGLHIKDNWKAEGMFALFDGDRLVTRSANRSSLVDAQARIEKQIDTRGVRPFSSRVAPVEIVDSEDGASPGKSPRASWAE